MPNAAQTRYLQALADALSPFLSGGATDAEIVRDTIAAALVAGTNVTITPNDGADTITIAAAGTDAEVVRDTIAAALVAGSGVTITPNDGADTITVAADAEFIRDTIATALVSGTGVTVTPDDAGNTITVSRNEVIYDIDFSTLANNTLTNGNEVIDGLTYVAANMALLGTAAVQNGTGLRLAAGTSLGSATTMTDASQAAPYLALSLDQIPGYDPRRDITVEVYLSNLVTEVTGEGFLLGVFGPANAPSSGLSAARMRWAGIYNNAGSRALRVTSQASATNTTDTRTTHDVVGFRLNAAGLGSAWSSVYASGFATPIIGHAFVTATGTASPMAGASCSLILGLSVVNDASPTTAVTLRRLRVMQQ